MVRAAAESDSLCVTDLLLVIQLNAAVKDHTRNIKRTVTKSIVLSGSESFSTPFQEIHEVVKSGYSNDGKYKAVLRETQDKKRFVEIWDGDKLEACKEVTDVHGAFYSDGSSRQLCCPLILILLMKRFHIVHIILLQEQHRFIRRREETVVVQQIPERIYRQFHLYTVFW